MPQESVHIWWDTSSEPEKWRVDVLRKNSEGEYEVVLGSAGTNFPILVEDFGTFEEDLLIQSLREAFPDASIRLKLL